ncbi:mannitol dehydrogenase family protein [Rhizobium sp.]
MQTPILQFGTSRFLQAHADLFVSEAMKRGEALGDITIVQTTGSSERSGRLAALAAPDGFPVHIKGKKDGRTIDEVVRVTSVKRALSALDQWAEVERIFAGETKLVICNTADAGYDVSRESDNLPESVPASFPGKLAKLLLARYRNSGEALTILPAELIPKNGERLKEIVTALANTWRLGGDFLSWLDEKAIFSNTLVDRIVSEPIEPAGAVAEPYALWAIEKRHGMVLPCNHPDIVVTEDIGRYEQLKLFILNLGHTFLTQRWLEAGLDRAMTVKVLLARPEMLLALQTLYADEVVPGFALRGMGKDAEAYVKQTIERFENPFLEHRLTDIHQNHAEKIRRRMGGFLDWSGADAPTLQAMLESVR